MRKSYVVWIIVSLLICILVGGVVWADWGDDEQNFTRSFPEYGFSITAPCELKDVSVSGNTLVHLKGITDENTTEMTVYDFAVFRQPGGYRLSDLTSFFTTELDDVKEVRIGHERFPGYVGYSYNRRNGLSMKLLFVVVNQDVVALNVAAYDGLEVKFTEFLNGFSREQNELELERIEKVIETRFYKPIKYGDEWLCGEEYYSIDKPNIVYYDRYGNEIIKEKIDEQGDVYKIVKSYYYSPKKGLREKITEEYPPSNSPEKSAYWKRDDGGRLIEIQGEVWPYAQPMSCEYDKQGRKIKVKEGDHVTYMSYPLGDQSMLIELHEKYSMNYNYEGKKVLIESNVFFYDKKTKLLKRRIQETYEYGHLDSHWDIKYTFNADGKIISKSGDGLITPLKISFERGVTRISKNYDQGASKKSSYRYDWIYDEYGHLIKKVHIEDGEVDEEWVYEYNEYGDWVKCIQFGMRDVVETYPFRKEKQAVEITLREITYHMSLYRRMLMRISPVMNRLRMSFKRWFIGEEDPV